MAGMKANKVGLGLRLQPTAGVYNEPTQADMIAINEPDDGYEDVTAEDATQTGSIFAAPRQFIGRRGRAGATFNLRGPGGATPFAAGAWGPGLIMQAAGFAEIINPTEITGAAGAGTTSSIVMTSAASAIDDFYKGMPIQHALIGDADTIRGTSIISDFDGATKTATILDIVSSAITGGNWRIPPSVNYLLGNGEGIPLLSAKVWRHKKARRYRDCALSSFALNIPVGNLQSTDVPTIEFSMFGVPLPSVDELAPILPQRLLTPTPIAKKGKFIFAGVKMGHQTMRLEFGLETGALPNQNFDEGQESYEVISGTQTLTLDLNEQLKSQFDFDDMTENQREIGVLSGWGTQKGQRFIASVPTALPNSFNPQSRNGFVGLSGGAAPNGVDRAIGLSLVF